MTKHRFGVHEPENVNAMMKKENIDEVTPEKPDGGRNEVLSE